jgi:hypothetical protein
LGGLKDIIPLAGALCASSAKDIIELLSAKDIIFGSCLSIFDVSALFWKPGPAKADDERTFCEKLQI